MLDFLKKTHPWKKFETKTDEDEDRIIAGLHLSKFLVFLTYPTIVKFKLHLVVESFIYNRTKSRKQKCNFCNCSMHETYVRTNCVCDETFARACRELRSSTVLHSLRTQNLC